MTDRDKPRRMRWCEEHRNDPLILEWLRRTPPPVGWKETPLEWAYTECSLFDQWWIVFDLWLNGRSLPPVQGA